jgi:hypothetical protein
MNCRKEWSLKTLVNKFTRKFVDKDYKEHRERCLFEKERALLPATQPVVEEMKRRAEIKRELSKIREEINRLTREYITMEGNMNRKEDIKENRVFVRHCPNENCNGFLSSQWKCGLCELWACPECHEIKGEKRDTEHKCKPENVETAKMIEKETRQCPSCASSIFKIDGCDQMWCTQCHTAFSWTTGRVENTIHNPHYYEWLKRNGEQERNPLEVQCGREIDNYFINNLAKLKSEREGFEICRRIIHIRLVEMPKYTINRVGENEDLRVRFMLKEITETGLKKLLQKREKQANKKQEIANILAMYVNSATDIMYRYMDELTDDIDFVRFEKYWRELINLNEYVKECLIDVGNVYKSNVNMIIRQTNLC